MRHSSTLDIILTMPLAHLLSMSHQATSWTCWAL